MTSYFSVGYAFTLAKRCVGELGISFQCKPVSVCQASLSLWYFDHRGWRRQGLLLMGTKIANSGDNRPSENE